MLGKVRLDSGERSRFSQGGRRGRRAWGLPLAPTWSDIKHGSIIKVAEDTHGTGDRTFIEGAQPARAIALAGQAGSDGQRGARALSRHQGERVGGEAGASGGEAARASAHAARGRRATEWL